jgi:hypothetical protein
MKRSEYKESGEPGKCGKLQVFEPPAHVVGPAKFVRYHRKRRSSRFNQIKLPKAVTAVLTEDNQVCL